MDVLAAGIVWLFVRWVQLRYPAGNYPRRIYLIYHLERAPQIMDNYLPYSVGEEV